jgi:hypothetical protein
LEISSSRNDKIRSTAFSILGLIGPINVDMVALPSRQDFKWKPYVNKLLGNPIGSTMRNVTILKLLDEGLIHHDHR